MAEAMHQTVATNPSSTSSSSAINAFSHMHALRAEVGDLFQAIGRPCALVNDTQKWVLFVELLTGVLADQPIVDPSPNVCEIRLEPKSHDCLITFRNVVAGQATYRHSRL